VKVIMDKKDSLERERKKRRKPLPGLLRDEGKLWHISGEGLKLELEAFFPEAACFSSLFFFQNHIRASP